MSADNDSSISAFNQFDANVTATAGSSTAVNTSTSVKKVPAISAAKTFYGWTKLPAELRQLILFILVDHHDPINPTDSARSPVNHKWDILRPDCPPKKLLLEVRNSQFSADVAHAYYGWNIFHLSDPLKARKFLRRIGEKNVKRLRWVGLELHSGFTKPSPTMFEGISLQYVCAQNLTMLSKNQNFKTLAIGHKGDRFPPPRVSGSRLHKSDPDEIDPLHDFTDGRYRFHPMLARYDGRYANDIILALIKFRNVQKLKINLGGVAGPHWDVALQDIMQMAPGEALPVALAIVKAWRERKAWDKAGNDPWELP